MGNFTNKKHQYLNMNTLTQKRRAYDRKWKTEDYNW